MNLINIPPALLGNNGTILKPGDVRLSKDLIMVGSRTDSNTNNSRGKWQENFITVEDLIKLIPHPAPLPPPVITVIPSVIPLNTNFVIGDREIGINVGGFTYEPLPEPNPEEKVQGTVTAVGTGQIVLL